MKCDVVRTDDRLEIRLIDTRDIFTFYLCVVSPSDFYVMKREQDIIVDYERFVSVLVKMLHGLQNARLTGIFSRETNKFLFVEDDEFRNIVRLELAFSKPNESHYKMYLGDVIGRMESDNVKLIKENGMLREKCRGGEKELRDRIRYLEEELGASQRRIEKLHKENESLGVLSKARAGEIDNLNGKVYELEKENARMQYEADKLRLQDVKNTGLLERAQTLDSENATLRAELDTANDIIRKYTDEIAQAKATLAGSGDATKELRTENKRLRTEAEELRKRVRAIEERTAKTADDEKNAQMRIKQLEAENAGLVKRLENAQNVYNHFYSKTVDNPMSINNYSENESVFSISPESPPH